MLFPYPSVLRFIFLCYLFVFFLTACGTSNSSVDMGSGAISAKLIWLGGDSVGKLKPTGKAATGVTIVRFIVSGADMTTIQKDFLAEDGSGVIDGIPAGSMRTLIVQGLDLTGNPIYTGSIMNITVFPDQKTDLGTIFMEPLLIIVDGYADRLSISPDENINFYLNSTNNSSGTVGVYDLNGNRVDSLMVTAKPQTVNNQNPSENGFGYEQTVIYKIPSLKSGLYLLDRKIPFLVKEPSKNSDIVVLYPSNTEIAYNDAGGKSFYTTARGYVLSYLRPWKYSVSLYCFDFLKWFQSYSKYTVSYITDPEMDNYDEIANAKLLIITGHSEYWTRKARENFDRFVSAGKPVLILSGNTMYWQVRYSDDGKKLICYKNSALDPVADLLQKTILWSDPSLKYPEIMSIGADFNHGGLGLDVDQGWDGFKLVNVSDLIFAGTGLQPGDILKMRNSEYDGTFIAGVDMNGNPLIDNSKLGFYQINLIGYDRGVLNGAQTTGTWIVFKKTPDSGTVMNVASNNWCSFTGIGGPNGSVIKQITLNMIDVLMENKTLFSTISVQ
jgi:hypothetical protein